MATKGDQIRNLVKAFGGTPRNSTIEDAIEDLVDLFTEKREVEMVEIIPEMEVDLDAVNDKILTDYGAPVSEGETYIVLYDGAEYECVSTTYDLGDDGFVYLIGNTSLTGYTDVDTNEPFGIAINIHGSGSVECYMYQLYASEPGTHTISISHKKETVTPPVVSLPRVEKKMVEIFPEQSVTGTPHPYYDVPKYLFNLEKELTARSKYIVKINGLEYGIETDDVSKSENKDGFDFATIPFAVHGDSLYWSNDLGETITLAIYEEEEVAEPLDPKIVGIAAVKLEVVRDNEGQTVGLKSSIHPVEINKMMTKGIPVIGYDNTHTYTLSIGGEHPWWELSFACVDSDAYGITTYKYFSFEKKWVYSYHKLTTESLSNEFYENITD